MQRANLGDPKKGAPVILAVSPTLEGIKERIATFLACLPEDIEIAGEQVIVNSKLMVFYRVIPWKVGYCFVAVQD